MLTAADVMRRDPCRIVAKPGLGAAAAERLLRIRDVDFGYVHDTRGRYLGVVAREALAEAVDAGRGLEDFLDRGVDAVAGSTPLRELYARAAAGPCPIPVVDEQRRLVGIVTKADVLARLARQEVA